MNFPRQRTQHQLSLHRRNNTLVLPPPSSASSYCSPQPKSNPQACAPLGNFGISRRWDYCGGCTLTFTMPLRQFQVEVLPYLLQFSLPSGTSIDVKIWWMHRGVKNNLKIYIEFKEDPNLWRHNSSMLHETMVIWMPYYPVPLHYSSTKARLKLSNS